MNLIAEEMRAVLNGDDDYLEHYGMPRRSGRYPWGSGKDPYQHAVDFLGRVEELRKQGFTFTDEKGKTYSGDTAIAKSLGLSTTQFRTELGLANDERRSYDVARVKSLSTDGYTPTQIGKMMGINESSVRSLLNSESEARMQRSKATAEILKKRMAEIAPENGLLDIGKGTERELNISKEKLDQAVYMLEREGYVVYNGRFEQPTNRGQFTTQKVLCPPGTKYSEIYDLDRVKTIKEYITRDGGETFEKKFHYPESMSSKRLQICYKEDGGVEKDGIIELRRGVDDLSLGNSRYSQVRILVDGTHYLKGMAVYSDDLPDGVDVRFNTNKKKGTPTTDVLKKIKDDPENPFGSAIKDVEQGGQYWYTDKKTGEKKLGLINKRADEGDWSEWSDSLPSQFLAKQSRSMIKKQLDLAMADKQAEFDSICELTNPTVKKHLLQKFSDTCDSDAVHLKGAALPGQKYHVILPINTLKDDQVYAPGYPEGSKLALVRYPHGGTFEIPILTVTHKNALGDKIISKQSLDAVGITSKVAERLSGADFDGDTVMCIPTHDKRGKVKITSTPPLKDLEGFDNKALYQYDKAEKDTDGTMHYYKNGKEFRPMTKAGTQIQMGIISNLITDMTLAGADEHELARAVKHSMVVIDAEKHKLDYKQSEIDNNIAALHKQYQGKTTGGAATILSRAKGQERVDKRKGSPKVNLKGKDWYDPTQPEGALIWTTDPDATYTTTKTNKRTGVTTTETHTRQQLSTKMKETGDANTLVSQYKHPTELLYADYANSMKALANRARKEMVTTGKVEYSATANKTYKSEVSSLMSKLNTALLNTTRERAANRMANAEVAAKKKNNPDMDKGDIKKASQRALSKYRQQLGSISRKDRNIDITDREWEAIQAGAISENKLKQILSNTDIDVIRQRATPRATKTISAGKVATIKAMAASNYSLEQIARKVGCSTSTVSDYLKGVK